MEIKGLQRGLSALALIWLSVATVPVVKADATLSGEKWTDSIKFNGDLRLRHESFFVKSRGAAAANSSQDRNRERLRLRFGVTGAIQDFTAGIRFASGVGEQVSTNQTYQNVFNQKGLFIDQAYITWKAHEYVKFSGGKMINPFWRTYASDIVWDDDVNPEGYAQQVSLPLGERMDLFANFAQLPFNEGGTLADPWIFGNQIGSNIKLSEDSRLSIAGAFYGFTNEKAGDFITGSTGVRQYGNTRVGSTAQLATNMRLLQFTGELASHVGPLPIALDGDFVRNTQDTANLGSNGYQTGVILGKAKAAGTWEVAYFYKYAQTNASYADIADSDFGYTGNGGGGLNRKGSIFWAAYASRDYLTLKLKYFITDVLNPYINQYGQSVTTPAFNSINRFQMDVVLKF